MGRIQDLKNKKAYELYQSELFHSDKKREFYADNYGTVIGFRIERENGRWLEYDAIEQRFLPETESLLEKYKGDHLVDVSGGMETYNHADIQEKIAVAQEKQAAITEEDITKKKRAVSVKEH